MLRAAGMRKSGTRVRAMNRGLHVRLLARRGPPARSVALGIAHLDATASTFGFGAMAVATSRLSSAEHHGGIGRKGCSAGEQGRSQTEEPQVGQQN